MNKSEAEKIFFSQFGCKPENFRGINEPYYFVNERVWNAMKTLGICANCLGSGTAWTECCNGAGGCMCQGQAVSFNCKVCKGTGRLQGLETGKENLQYIHATAVANKGYMFPK